MEAYKANPRNAKELRNVWLRKRLLEGTTIQRSQMMFRSRKHKVKTLEVNKLALSREDDKRVSIGGLASLAMGHYKVWGCE